MSCLYPVHAWRSQEINPETGKRGLVFNSKDPRRLAEGFSLSVPCGRCIGCRIDRSKEWAVRCMHEAQIHKDNCFLTLTYNDKNLPDDFSVAVRPLQIFLKKLRHRVPQKIRFFACGEYGEDDPSPLEGNRPHYHVLIFNFIPNDLKLHSKNQENQNLYTSELLSSLWPYGFSTIGNLTYQSAAYTARYTLKKYGGDNADDHYTRIHPLSGNLVRVKPEFMTCSRRPGIGEAWFNTFKSDVYPCDFVVVDGKPHAVPKYYHRKLSEEELKPLKIRRAEFKRRNRADSTPARLRVRETVLRSRVSLLKRSLKEC